jgi:hypothetical protein
MIRSLSLMFAATLALNVTPAWAGTAEDAFLGKLAGSYGGTGKLTGGRTGALSCTLTIRSTAAGASYRGKCDVPEMGPQGFSGDISYNDKARRYEATSPTGMVTVGSKSGSTLTFNAKIRGMATGNSVMKLSAGRVTVDTSIDDPNSGLPVKAHIDMKR